MADLPFIVFGAGGHAKVVLEAALEAGLRPVLIVDDAPRTGDLCGIPVCAPTEKLWGDLGRFAFVVGLGENASRARKFAELRCQGGSPVNVIHPSAVVARSATLGPGTVCMAGVVINADARVNENCIINTAASVDHDAILGAHVHLAPGVRLAGMVSIGQGTMLGLGTVVLPNMTVGEWTTVGAGSVVNRPIPSRVVAFGSPARVRRQINVEAEI
jgi:acetyltransferase EpsM